MSETGAGEQRTHGRGRAGASTTPALVCAVCRGETPLESLQPRAMPPVCPHCETPFAGFGSLESSAVDRRYVVLDLIERLNCEDVAAATALLRPDVQWREPERGVSAYGREAVAKIWRSDLVSRSLDNLTVVDELVVGLLVERSRTVDQTRVVRWLVEIEGALVRSCWVWEVRRGQQARGGGR